MTEPLITSELLNRLEQLTLVSRRMTTGRLKGERRSRRRGSSNDFADYRNYVAGDDLRNLDWKIYARLEKLCLKLFLEEEDLRVYILLDVSRSMNSGNPDKMRYAKQVAAALGHMAMSSMDSLVVHTFGQGLQESFGPKRGKVNSHRYFDWLTHTGEAETTALEPSLKQFAGMTQGNGVVILISDFYDFEGYDDALKHLFGRDFDVFAIHVMSPQEVKPDLHGDVRLVDSEQGTTTDVSVGRTLLDTYTRTLNTFCSGIRDSVVRRGGTYMMTSTDTPFERLILDMLRRRGVVR